jgi:hypothetical protein
MKIIKIITAIILAISSLILLREVINKIKNYNNKIILIIFIIVANSIFADGGISIFQQNAINYDSGYFYIDDNFKILGNIEINGRNIVLANNVHIWGASTERATWRFLLFLDDGTFLGMYTGIAFNTNEIRIEGQKIYFSFDPEIGNVIDFTEGIPNRIWIDGYIFLYMEGDNIENE